MALLFHFCRSGISFASDGSNVLLMLMKSIRRPMRVNERMNILFNDESLIEQTLIDKIYEAAEYCMNEENIIPIILK